MIVGPFGVGVGVRERAKKWSGCVFWKNT